MSRGPVVRVDGARELRRTMKRAGDDLQELKDAHNAVAGIVVGRVSVPRLTGNLASTVRAGATKTAALARAGGARVPYAGPIHWGWPAHNIQAQSFLLDAAHSTEPQWTAEYQRAVDKILARVKGD